MGLGDYLKPIVSIAAAYVGYQIGGPVGGAIGWSLGMGIGGALFPPEAEKTATQSLGPAQALEPQANIGGVVPVLHGQRRIAGNIIWHQDVRQVSQWQDVIDWDGFSAAYLRFYPDNTDRFAATFANSVCIGPAAISRIYDGKDEYICDGSYAKKINVGDNVPTEYMNKSADEILEIIGPLNGDYDFQYTEYYGDQTTADPTIVTAQGVNVVPPYRNLCYSVIHDFPVKDLNSEIPGLTFEAQKLLTTDPAPTPVLSDHLHTNVTELAMYFGSFYYKGYYYVLDSEHTIGDYYQYWTDGYGVERWYEEAHLLSGMKKYEIDTGVLVASYTFEKRWLTGPHNGESYLAEDYDISVDEIGQRVLVVGMCGILIDMSTLTEGGTNYYKVFPNTSEYNTYLSGGNIYYGYRQACVYGNDRETAYHYLDGQYSDTPITNTSTVGLTPLGSMRGLLIPSTAARNISYFVSPSFYGFKKQSLSNGEILEYITPSGTTRGFTPTQNWGDGNYFDHTMVEKFHLGDDGFLYVVFRIVYGRTYFGLYDPLGNYDTLLIRYSVGPIGELTEVSRKLFSEMVSLTPTGYTGYPQAIYPLYNISFYGIDVSRGYVYLTFQKSGTNCYLVKLRCSDLAVVLTSTDAHTTGSPATYSGTIKAFRQRYGPDKLAYYCQQGHLHIMSMSFVDEETSISVNETGIFSHSMASPMFVTGMRGSGRIIFPGSFSNALYKYVEYNPEYTAEIDTTPQQVSEQILTNEFYGEGLDSSVLETTMTGEAEQYSLDNDLLLSLVFDQQRSVLDALSYVAGHHNGFFTADGGLIAHRQLEIDDEDMTWAGSTSLSDNFSDGMLGDQWRMIGDVPPYARAAYQNLTYTDIVQLATVLRIPAIQTLKTSDSATADFGIRRISVSDGFYISQGDRWNYNDKNAGITLSNGNQRAVASSSGSAQSVRSISYKSGSGKYYLEIQLSSPFNVAYFGIDDGTCSLSAYPGMSAYSWSVMENRKYHNSVQESSGMFIQAYNDLVMIALDLDNNKVWFGRNGTWVGNPAAGTGEMYSGLDASKYYAMVGLAASTPVTINFGQNAFTYSIPIGFQAWSRTEAEIEGEKYIKVIQPMKITDTVSVRRAYTIRGIQSITYSENDMIKSDLNIRVIDTQSIGISGGVEIG